MKRVLLHYGRVARAALAVAVFAAMCLTASFVLVPISRLWPGSGPRDLRAQRILHAVTRGFNQFLVRIGLMELRVIGVERLRAPGAHLVVANHPTMGDISLLLSLLPQVDCIVNVARSSHWLLARAISSAGYVSNDRGAVVVEECARRLSAGRSLLIFPEGTRSPEGALGKLRRGAAHIALEAVCDLQPVTITCEPLVLTKQRGVLAVPDRPFVYTVRVEEPISVKPYLEAGLTRPIAARRLTEELETLFLARVTCEN